MGARSGRSALRRDPTLRRAGPPVRLDDRELIPAEPRQDVCLPELGFQAVRKTCCSSAFARRMAIAVVHLLEAVEGRAAAR